MSSQLSAEAAAADDEDDGVGEGQTIFGLWIVKRRLNLAWCHNEKEYQGLLGCGARPLQEQTRVEVRYSETAAKLQLKADEKQRGFRATILEIA